MTRPLALVMCVLLSGGWAYAQPKQPRHLGRGRDLAEVTLVRSGDQMAVIRFGDGPLETIRRGDRLGRHRAEVTEVISGRLTVAEVFPGKDGRPNRAQVIWFDGERGGQRYHERLERAAPPATKQAARPPGPG